jgi:predicted anti-sigma-YlaC factor YlaD
MAVVDHEEVAEMLAAYSLDALPPDEAALVEEHLADCPRCRAELASLLEVAALLAGSNTAPPEGLWDRIASELTGPGSADGPPAVPPVTPPVAPPVTPPATPPAPPVRPIESARRARAWRAATVGLVAVLLAVLGVLSYRVVNLDNRVGQLQSALTQHGPGQQVALALADPAHQSIQLTAKDSTVTATVILLPDGRAYWVDTDLAALPPGRTYQLWALSSGKVVSLGVLGRSPENVPFRVERTMSLLMVTAEPTGGVPAPTTAVLLAGPVAS